MSQRVLVTLAVIVAIIAAGLVLTVKRAVKPRADITEPAPAKHPAPPAPH